MTHSEDFSDLIDSAQLFGRLLVAEIDMPLLQELQSPAISSALESLGVVIPTVGENTAIVEELASQFCAHFLVGEDHVPLIQSVWETGSYETDSAQALLELTLEAGLELDDELSRSAPLDHLGSILQLWAELAQSWPKARDYIALRHLQWAEAPLEKLQARDGFYPQVAGVTLYLIELIQQATESGE